MNNHDLIKTLKHIPFNSIEDKIDHAIKIKILTPNHSGYIGNLYSIRAQKFYMRRPTSSYDPKTFTDIQKEFCQYMLNELTSPDNSNTLYINYINNNPQLKELLLNPDNIDKQTIEGLTNALAFYKLLREQGFFKDLDHQL